MSVQRMYEAQLMGRLLAERNAYYELSDSLSEDLFIHYGDVFGEMSQMVRDGRQITLTKVTSKLPQRKKDLIQVIREYDPTVRIDEVLAELEESRRMRILDNAMTRAAMASSSQDRLAHINAAVIELAKSERTQFKEGHKVAREVINNLAQPKSIKLPTGFRYLDVMMNGLQPSDLVVVAGRTSQGKTSFALNISQKMVEAGRTVVFISLEMNEGQLMTRMVCTKSGVPVKDIEQGHGYAQVQMALTEMEQERFYVADVHNNSATHILGLIRGAHIRYGADVVMIDYLQLMSDRGVRGSREQEVGQMARALKNIAKELNIPVVILSQLNRPEKGKNPYPTLSDLRDSGQIEEAADVVIFVYRPEMYGMKEYNGQDAKGLAEIIMAKGRNYGTGRFRCRFEDKTTQFRDFHDTGGTDHATPPEEVEDEVPF
jgi:replicative DNA helicase